MSQVVARADKGTHLQFEIDSAAGAELRRSLGIGTRLAVRPSHGGAAEDHRTGASVIGHGKIEPVGLERAVFAAKHRAHIRGMFFGRIKIGVVADLEREPHRDVASSEDGFAAQRCIVAQSGLVRIEQFTEPLPNGSPGGRSLRGEGIERVAGEEGLRGLEVREEPGGLESPDVQDVLADGDSARCPAIGSLKDAPRKVLDRKWSR